MYLALWFVFHINKSLGQLIVPFFIYAFYLRDISIKFLIEIQVKLSA